MDEGLRPVERIVVYEGCIGGAKLGISSDVELEEKHVPILDDVFLSFHAVEPPFPSRGDGTALHEIVIRHGFRLDKAPLAI